MFRGKDVHISSSAVAMKCLILLSVIGLAAAGLLQGYNLPGPGSGGFTHGHSGSFSQGTSFGQGSTSFGQGISSGSTSFGQGISFGTSSGTTFGHGTSSGVNFGINQGSCGGGQVRHVDGRCVTPRVNRRVFLYDVPSNVQTSGPVNIPEPRVETNVLLIRTPEGGLGPQPVVIPPPRQQHVVYVLNKQSSQDQRVIEVPSSGPSTPEVYFVNYADGENPTLPSGVDLQTALQSASQGTGQDVGSAISSGQSSSFSSSQSFDSGTQVFDSGSSFVSQPSGLYTQP
nr:uncharacterized protein LOC113800010 [Penaeus vannamei]